MKGILLIASIFLSNLIYAQPTIFKTWIGEQQEVYYLTKKGASISFGNLRYRISYTDSVLVLSNKRHLDIIEFKVSKMTNDSLILVPINNRAKKLTNNKSNYILYANSPFDKKNFNFQKIYFSGTGCYGSCPVLKMRIDSMGQILFFGESYTSDYKGLYKGKLTKKQLDKLKHLIKNSRLDKLPAKIGERNPDATTYIFKFYYNNVVKSCQGSSVPKYAEKLRIFLLAIYMEVKLTKINDTGDF